MSKLDWNQVFMWATIILILSLSMVWIGTSIQDNDYSVRTYCSSNFDSCSCEVHNFGYNDEICTKFLTDMGYKKLTVVE